MKESAEWTEVISEIRFLKAECELLIRLSAVVEELEQHRGESFDGSDANGGESVDCAAFLA